MEKSQDTSWQKVGTWYDSIVGAKGHYFHEHVILPYVLNHCKKCTSLLDLACGQGVLARNLVKTCSYVGIDLSKDLIKQAKSYHKNDTHTHFFCADVTKDLPLDPQLQFDRITIILALQNIEHPHLVFKQAAKFCKETGRMIIVMNHPCFRIPRKTHWGIDEPTKSMYRKVFCYMSPQKIPIQAHPGSKPSVHTWTFHHPLSSYSKWLKDEGFSIEQIDELCSDKKSTGRNARMEDRARLEFPMFLSIVAKKN